MTPEDPRHGTTRGYSQHYRDNEPPCDPCRDAKKLEASKRREYEDDDIALTEGAWRFDPFRRIRVWVPEPFTPPTSAPKADVHQLIACPKCHARADQTCRTKNGERTKNHTERLIPRLCRCGASLEQWRKLCDECRNEAARESQRGRRKRAREVAA